MSKPQQLAVQGPADYTLTVTVTPEALAERQGLLETASMVVAVGNPEDQQLATTTAANLKRWSKLVEETRVDLTKPLLEGQRTLMAAAKEAVKNVDAEAKRIEGLLADFHRQQEAERQRVQREQERVAAAARAAAEAEQRRKDDAAAELKRQADEAARQALEARSKKARQEAAELAAKLREQQEAAEFEAGLVDDAPLAVYVPAPEVVKPAGASVKKTIKFEVTDIAAFYKAHPELCEVTVKTQAVNYFINTPEQDINNIPGIRCWEDTKVAVSTR